MNFFCESLHEAIEFIIRCHFLKFRIEIEISSSVFDRANIIKKQSTDNAIFQCSGEM